MTDVLITIGKLHCHLHNRLFLCHQHIILFNSVQNVEPVFRLIIAYMLKGRFNDSI